MEGMEGKREEGSELFFSFLLIVFLFVVWDGGAGMERNT